MKFNLITFTALSALALGSTAFAHDPQDDQQGGRGGAGHARARAIRRTAASMPRAYGT